MTQGQGSASVSHMDTTTATAPTFVRNLAAKLEGRGWDVELTDSDDGYGRVVRFVASGKWYDGVISGQARLSPYTRRWSFLGVSHINGSDTHHAKTYSDARITVEVYGTDYNRYR